MTQQMTVSNDPSERLLQVLVGGNLAVLTAAERVDYYTRVCESLQLNPLTKPFEFITLNGKLVLYALKGATDQLRAIHKISISEPHVSQQGDMYIVTVSGTDETGRTDSDMGVVAVGRLSGENLANAMLKAVTKAKRRLTLSICGLGMLDETEIADIPEAAKRPAVQMPQTRVAAPVDQETGEYQEPAPRPQPAAKEPPFGSEDWGDEPKPASSHVLTAFFERAEALGYSEAQVLSFAQVDSLEGATRDDLQQIITGLKEASGQAQLVAN